MILDRAAILSKTDLPVQVIPVPEWGGEVRIRALTGTQRDALGRSMADSKGKDGAPSYFTTLAALAIVGEDNKTQFTVDDLSVLGELSGLALERVGAAAHEMNHMGAKAVEDAEGN